jgi:hypothetical protein
MLYFLRNRNHSFSFPLVQLDFQLESLLESRTDNTFVCHRIGRSALIRPDTIVASNLFIIKIPVR